MKHRVRAAVRAAQGAGGSCDRRRAIKRISVLNSLTLRHLRVVAGLADRGRVARVAEMLNVTQPAVSKQIAELERLVGAPVVTRRRNRLTLTPLGERLAEHARQVIRQLDRAAFDIEAMSMGLSGSVTVGAVTSLAPILLPGAIALLKRSAPSASVTVMEGHFVSLFPLLEAGSIDLLIARTWQPQELPGIEQAVLMREPVVVTAGRNHPLATRSEVSWAEAAEWPWILPEASSVARRAIDALFAGFGLVTPANHVVSLSLAVNLGLLREMPILALFPGGLAQVHAARGDLIVLPLDTQELLSEARCFWRRGQPESNSTFGHFLECLMQARSDVTV